MLWCEYWWMQKLHLCVLSCIRTLFKCSMRWSVLHIHWMIEGRNGIRLFFPHTHRDICEMPFYEFHAVMICINVCYVWIQTRIKWYDKLYWSTRCKTPPGKMWAVGSALLSSNITSMVAHLHLRTKYFPDTFWAPIKGLKSKWASCILPAIRRLQKLICFAIYTKINRFYLGGQLKMVLVVTPFYKLPFTVSRISVGLIRGMAS